MPERTPGLAVHGDQIPDALAHAATRPTANWHRVGRAGIGRPDLLVMRHPGRHAHADRARAFALDFLYTVPDLPEPSCLRAWDEAPSRTPDRARGKPLHFTLRQEGGTFVVRTERGIPVLREDVTGRDADGAWLQRTTALLRAHFGRDFGGLDVAPATRD